MKGKRILSFLLSLVMLVSLTTGVFPTSVSAATPSKGATVYLGKWGGYDIPWTVLDTAYNTGNGTGILLVSKYLLGTTYYDPSSPYSNVWSGSTAQSWCTTFLNANGTNGLTSAEAALLMPLNKNDASYTVNGYTYSSFTLSGDKVFFLSAQEASTYFANDAARVAYTISNGGSSGTTNNWWLRSPNASDSDSAGLVTSSGPVLYDHVANNRGARPALVLNPSSSNLQMNSDGTWEISSATAPKAPTITNIVPGNGQLTVSWSAPTDNGGADVTGYYVYVGGTQYDAGTATSKTVTGLKNGQSYTVQVAARNSVGTGTKSTAQSAIPRTNPAAPTGVKIDSEGDGTLTVSWSAVTNTGANSISKYKVYVGGTAYDAGTATTKTVSGLQNGTPYTVYVTAVNNFSLESTPSGTVTGTPKAAPNPPGGLGAEVLSGTSVKLTWKAATENGASVTGYTVTSTPTGGSIAYSGNTATITGLARNTQYTFSVVANSSAGSSTPVAISVTTLTKPTAPTVSVTPGNTTLGVTVTKPADDGGADITEYVVYYRETAGSGWQAVQLTGGTSTTISGLTNGTSYTVWATAKNSAGQVSPDSATVTATPRTVPGAPATVTATVTGKTTVKLTWTAPADTGGAAIDTYVIESKTADGAWTEATTINALEKVIEGLAENTAYTFRVRAKNIAGPGEATESEPVKTWTKPETPTNVKVESGMESGVLVLTWQAGFDGNAKLLGYRLYIDGTEQEELIPADATEYRITGLTDGQVYMIQLAAATEAGDSDKSDALTGRPRSVPGAPEITEIKAGNKQAFISISAPEDDGGAAISGYKIYVDGEYNKTVLAKEVEDIAIHNLENNVTYTITVVAVNAAGDSQPSEGRSVKVGMPRPPENIKVVPGNAEFTVSYDAAEGNGNTITGYNIYVDGKVKATVDGDVLSTTVKGLINGKSYMVQVSTLSAAGESLLSDEYPIHVGAPTAPVLEEVVVDDTSITLRWTDSETHDLLMKSYNVYVNGVVETTNDADTRTATLSDLTKGQTYSIQVSGVNIAGEGEKSAPYTIVFGAPDAPGNVQVKGGDSSLTVTWEAADGNGSNILGYHIYVNGVKAGTAEAGATSKTVDGFANGVTYMVTVSADNEHGEGLKSEPVAGVPYTNSHAPTNVQATATGSTSAKLTWNAPINDGGQPISGYEVGGAEGATVEITGTTALITGLEPATEYTFTVAAMNPAGNSLDAPANTIRTWTTPDAPVITKLESGKGAATITWTAPKNDGGSAVTSYNVYVNGVQNNKEPITGNSYDVSYLTNGTFYRFTVAAVNAVGEGAKAAEERLCIGIPTIPVITSVTAGDGSATITWTESVENVYGITGYKVYIDGEETLVLDGGTSYTITGLNNGQTYTIALTAMCGKGETALSNAVTVTPGTLLPPANVQAAAGNANITLTWEAVAGATQYVVYLDGEPTEPVTETKAVLTGLLNQEYAVCVATGNTHGVGNTSPVIKVTPYTVPDAPVITGIVSTVDGFTVTYSEPKANGKEIKFYEIYADEEKVAESYDLSATVGGLAVKELYAVTVKAVSDAGASEPSAAVEIRIGAPGATQITSVEIGDGELTVHYSEAKENGSAITHYNIYVEVAEQDGVEAYSDVTVTSTTTSATIKDLVNGVNYAITVEAVNGIGTGPLSDPYHAVPGAPSAPTMQSTNAGDRKVTITWKAPLDNAESVTKYRIYIDGEFYSEATSLTAEITGLENGKTYAFSVTAVNANGESPKAEPMSAMPCTVPGVPQRITAVASGKTSVTLTWAEPANNGGMPVTGYIVEGDGVIGDVTETEDGFGVEITGLESGETYVFTVKAVNDCGDGAVGSSDKVTTLTVPGKPAIVLLAAGDSSITIEEWEEPDNGGSDILGYNVYYRAKSDASGELVQANDELVTATPYTFGGLENGETYYVYIEAVNGVGESEMSSAVGASPAVIGEVVVPSAPRNFNVEVGNRTITATWDAPIYNGNSEIKGYYVYLNGGKYSELITETEYAIDNLTNGTTYTIYVRAANVMGVGDPTEVVSAIPAQTSTAKAPGAISNLAFTMDIGKQNAILTWDKPDNGGSEILGYYVYVNNVLYQASTTLDEAEGTPTVTVTDTRFELPVTLGNPVAVSVSAVNEVDEGPRTQNIAVAYNLNNTNEDGEIINKDLDGDGKADIDIDTDDDGKADMNIDTDDDGEADLSVDTNNDGKPDLNVDTDGDGDADVNIDTNNDGEPDVNVDTNGDGKADINIDTNEDGEADINLDTDGDGKADLNIDTDEDGEPDVNIDTNGDGRADLNIDTDGDGIPDININTDEDDDPEINIDKNGDGKADLNIDTNDDNEPDVNVDTDGDGKADINIDTDGDGVADANIDTNEDDEPDENITEIPETGIDTDEDGEPDVNVDTNGDGKADLNIDTNDDKKPDVNVDTNGDGKADINIDTDGDGDADLNLDTDGDGEADTNVDKNGDGIPDDADDTSDENKPAAPVITGTVSDAQSTIRVKWSAENAAEDGVVSYNVYIGGTLYASGVEELYYDITGADKTTDYVIQVTAVNADGDESTKSDSWTTNLYLNTGSDLDGDPTGAIDTNGDGEADDTAPVQVKVTGTIGFAGTEYLATAKLLDSNGFEVGTASAGNDQTFEITVQAAAGTTLDGTYSLVVSGKNATTTTVTGISLADGDANVGKVTIYAGDVDGSGDGFIMGDDLQAIKGALGKVDFAVDISGDGFIMGDDLQTVKEALGKGAVTIQWNSEV